MASVAGSLALASALSLMQSKSCVASDLVEEEIIRRGLDCI